MDGDVGVPAEPVLSELVQAASGSPGAAATAAANGGKIWSCSLTCNGKEPWFHGALPCWGELTVECESNESPGVAGHGRGLTESRHHAPGMIKAPDAELRGEGGVFKAQCLGLWTGVLGRMCWGETMIHAAKEWEGHTFDTWDICSGKLGVRSSKGSHSASMGHWCRGSEVQRISVTYNGESTA